MTLGDFTRAYRSEHSMNMQDFADLCGLSKAYISILERNINPSTGKPPIPSLETIRAISNAINRDFNEVIAALDSDQMVCIDSSDSSDFYVRGCITREPRVPIPSNVTKLRRRMKKVPLVGRIACGEPILAEQNISDRIDIPGHLNADFALVCQGDSMINLGVRDGDIVYIREQPRVENGQVAAVMVGDDEATLKRFYHENNIVQLIAENPSIPPRVFIGEEINQIRVIGRAVAFVHMIE